MPGGNLKPKIVSKNINTMIGNNMLTNSKYIILRSPQKYETKNDKTEIARRKSRIFAIIINLSLIHI